MTVLRSTIVGSLPGVPGRDSVSSPLTIFAARNVCRSIFSSSTRPRIGGVRVLEQHLGVARDAGERRVHFVRDAGRQQADRRHLLRNLQLLLQSRLLGDVLEQQNGAGDGAPDPARLWSGTAVAFTSNRAGLSSSFAASRRTTERHLEERGAARVLTAGSAQRVEERRVEDVGERAGQSPRRGRRRRSARGRDSSARCVRARRIPPSPSSSDSRMFSLNSRSRPSSSAFRWSWRYRRPFSIAVAT